MAKGKKFGGRVKGTPNKATLAAREAIAAFIDNNAHRLQEWLDHIAKDDPKAAITCFKDLIEFHVPKLGRTELTGDGGKPIEVNVVRFSHAAEPLGAAAVSNAGMANARTGLPPRSVGVAPKIG